MKLFNVEGQMYRVQFWDCPGAERHAKLVPRYAVGAAAAVFVFNGASVTRVGASAVQPRSARPPPPQLQSGPLLRGWKTGSGRPPRSATWCACWWATKRTSRTAR